MKKTKLCPDCQGEGIKHVSGYRNEPDIEDCDRCNKTGKIIVVKYRYEFPYGLEYNYKADEKIHNVIRTELFNQGKPKTKKLS